MPLSTPPAPHSPPPSAALHYGFAGMTIGASLADLRVHRPKAACGAPVAGMLDCTAPDQPLGGAYWARDLTYRFIDGRLAQVRFHTSIDGFAFVVARLKQDFGSPADTRKDTVSLFGHSFFHVAYTWRNGRSTIRLSDPTTPTQLSVSITSDADAPRVEASGT